MANTYTQIYLHIVFSTKHRKPLIHADIEQRVWEYIGGIARENKMTAIQVGGIEDHVHALVGTRPTVAPADAAQLLKGKSSMWIHKTFPELRLFGWQDGYAAFSVSRSAISDVVEYIKNQREHHKKQSFEDEYRSLLRLHGVEFDERYLFD